MKKDIIKTINLSEKGRKMNKARNKKLSTKRRKEISVKANLAKMRKKIQEENKGRISKLINIFK